MFFTPIRQSLQKKLDQAVESASKTPPRWVSYGVYWFRFGLGLFMLLTLMLSLFGCAPASPWRKADGKLPDELIGRAITHTSLSMDEAKKTLLFWRIPGKDGNLILFSYNSPDLCGKLGCLYSGYWQQRGADKEVLAGYFDANQPRGSQLFSVGEYSADAHPALPCLKVNQPLSRIKQQRELTLCLSKADEVYRVVQGGVIDRSKEREVQPKPIPPKPKQVESK